MSYINDPDDRIESSLSKFADDKRLGRKLPNIEEKLNRLKNWADRNLMKFNGGKMQVLHPAWFETILSNKTGRGLTG